MAQTSEPIRKMSRVDEFDREVFQVAAKIVEDPLHLRLLSDRVYELLINDLRQQKERAGGNYRGRL